MAPLGSHRQPVHPLDPVVALLGQKIHRLQVPAIGSDFQVAKPHGHFMAAGSRVRQGRSSGVSRGRRLRFARRPIVRLFVVGPDGQPRQLAGAEIALGAELVLPDAQVAGAMNA